MFEILIESERQYQICKLKEKNKENENDDNVLSELFSAIDAQYEIDKQKLQSETDT